MNTINTKKNNFSSLYKLIGLISFIYSLAIIIYSLYNHFYYVDGTWTHGFISNGFAVLDGLIWLTILFVFNRFLGETLKISKVDSLFKLYIIFFAIIILSYAITLYDMSQLFFSLKTKSINGINAFPSASILSVIFIFICSWVIIVISILLGIRFSKIVVFERKLFKILGVSFILHGILVMLISVYLIENNTINYLIKALMATIIGLILKKASVVDLLNSNLFPELQKTSETKQIKEDTILETYAKEIKSYKSNQVETKLEQQKPNLDVEKLEDKESVITYYESLSKAELNRLEHIVNEKYNHNLTNDQITNFVMVYISEKKLYDHQRFLPK